MPTSMRNQFAVKIGIFLCSIFSAQAQTSQATLEELGNLVNDAIFFTDKYITPATDGAVYQAAAGWMDTPKKKNLWDFSLGFHINTFLVPQSDRKFSIANSDFSFFTIQESTTAETPSALGNRDYVTLVGTLDGEQVLLKTPEGINRETVIYPYLQAALGLPYGTELIAKFSPRTTLKNVEYQVYGLGLKHNLSQYFKSIENKKVHCAALFAYSREDISVAFLDVQTAYGNLGLNSLNSLIDTWQLQFNAAKEFKKLELSAGLIMNASDFEYAVNGEKGEIENIIPLQQILNNKLKSIYKSKNNYIGEVAGRYQLGHYYLQTSVAFGKFVNSNVSLQYEF
jgi:hypothetical protein